VESSRLEDGVMTTPTVQPDPVAVAFNKGDEKYRVEVLGQMQGLVGRGVIDGHEYARGKHFFYRRPLDSSRWQLFCGADCDLTLEIAKAIHAEGRLLSSVELPDGYRRPMSCELDAPASRSIEFATVLAVEMNDTDDDAEIAKLAHEIDNHPNAFVLRVHRLEKRVAALEQQQLAIAGGHTE
jgi:hypothetical protein